MYPNQNRVVEYLTWCCVQYEEDLYTKNIWQCITTQSMYCISISVNVVIRMGKNTTWSIGWLLVADWLVLEFQKLLILGFSHTIPPNISLLWNVGDGRGEFKKDAHEPNTDNEGKPQQKLDKYKHANRNVNREQSGRAGDSDHGYGSAGADGNAVLGSHVVDSGTLWEMLGLCIRAVDIWQTMRRYLLNFTKKVY